MFKTIVVPVDLSNLGQADRMLEAAKELGGDGAKIVLTNIVDAIPAFAAAQIPGGYEEKAEAAAKDELTRIAKEAGVAAEIEVRVGHTSNAILEVADKHGADAIVIASHRPGLQDYFLGSTASRVVRHAKCSVLVIR